MNTRKPHILTAIRRLECNHVENFPTLPILTGGKGNDGRIKSIWEWRPFWERYRLDLAELSKKKEDRILVSGTTATHGPKAMEESESRARTHFLIDKIEGAIQSLGRGKN